MHSTAFMSSTFSIGAHVRSAIAIAASALALAGCAAGPDYVRPASSMAPAFHHAGAGRGDAPLQLDAWWVQFRDPALSAIIERVLAQNLDLAAALARVDQARAVAHLSNAGLLPRGALNAGAAAQHQSLEGPPGKLASRQPGYERDTVVYSGGLGASWEIDLAGGLRRGVEADSAEADRLGVRVSVAAEAADSYFRIRGAQARIALALDEVKANSDLLELVNLRLQGGLANRGEQAQAQARLAQVRAAMPPLRAELAIQLNRLDVLMGANPGTYAERLAGAAAATAVPAMNAALNPADLLRRRPDVISAERRLAATSNRIGVATAEYYPKFSLSGLLGFESLRSTAPSAASFQPQAVAGLRWRLFDFGRVDAEVARATGANAEALARYRQSMLRATEDVENALVMQVQLDDEQRELSGQVDAASRARDAAQDAYVGGAASLMEALEQDRQLLGARDKLALAATGSRRAAVATFRALGGGW